MNVNNRINLLKEVVSTFEKLKVDDNIAQMEPAIFFEIATAYHGFDILKDQIKYARSHHGINIFCRVGDIFIQTIISWEEEKK